MTIVVFLVSLGSVLRLNRLFIDDTIAEPIQGLWVRMSNSKNSGVQRAGLWFHELWSCPWCLGMWLAAGVTALAVVSGGAGWFLYPAIALSISWLAAIGYMFQEWMNGE